MRKSNKIKLIIYTIVFVIIVINFIIINNLQNTIDRLKIITSEGDSLLIVSPSSIEKPTVLLTSEMIDNFSEYKSPFNDNKSFEELIKKYINNRWTDNYGAIRGTRDCRRIHEGVDLYVKENTPVFPLNKYGIVTELSKNPHYLVRVECKREDGSTDSTMVEYGKTVRILYPEGIESIYTHLNKVFVELGQEVFADTKIGLTGLTGNIRRSDKSSHLHLELRDSKNRSFNPWDKLLINKGSVKFFIDHLKIEGIQ